MQVLGKTKIWCNNWVKLTASSGAKIVFNFFFKDVQITVFLRAVMEFAYVSSSEKIVEPIFNAILWPKMFLNFRIYNDFEVPLLAQEISYFNLSFHNTKTLKHIVSCIHCDVSSYQNEGYPILKTSDFGVILLFKLLRA